MENNMKNGYLDLEGLIEENDCEWDNTRIEGDYTIRTLFKYKNGVKKFHSEVKFLTPNQKDNSIHS